MESKSMLNKTPSGLIHTADSNANLPGGTFIEKYGAPGSPTTKSTVKDGNGRYKQPSLQTRFMQKGGK